MSRVLALAALILGLPLAASAAPAGLAPVAPVMACADLARIDLTVLGGEGSTVTEATQTTSDGIPVCSVTGRLAPQVTFQVLLPLETWTQRYLQVGCGGLCGRITLQSGASSGCTVLNDGGFVMAATDMGHTGQGGEWGLDDGQRRDFAWRAQHITALAAKALIRAFYGQDTRYSYFNGCSDGGREAIMEAMRFPDDFDGIVAGAPAMLFQVQNTLHHGWLARANTGADGKPILLSDKLPLLHRAVIAACDGTDGARDGLISQPAACAFDPATLVCKEGQAGDCLTAPEAAVAAKVYDGPRDTATGAPLTPGQQLPGSELNWQGVLVPDSPDRQPFSAMIADPVLRYLAFDPARPDMTLDDLAFTTATLDDLRARHALFDATSPDLSAFQASGGKLILWHGLADPHIAPANTLALHKGMLGTMGADTVAGFERLYLLPGVGHCGGGQGPSNLDLLTPMMAWVEGGTAPDAILTASTAETSSFGQPDGGEARAAMPPMTDLGVAPLPPMTRPVWPWPATAALEPGADPTRAESWTRGPDAAIVATRDWPGADLFTPFTPVE
ncbi:tannase/feruloyl esterase family alpha/beta hydrolase [Paracoccus shandongensis]|uniref:tannase/feruloyl esterase family alpha/beta hydrolase n=1 Tax=Paracoccus shandongensis TaxID=2816048 RepID=UPI001A8C844C|nr:tannase/feruloyl esterase family alpha/beta hydrolase [Paracoccus shandongensis]